jgi:transcriptional regulator with XRE-family HTH domain
VPFKSHDVVCSRVADLLKQARTQRGLSLNSVGQRAGLSYQMVDYVEKGLRNPTLQTLLRIASALELDLPEILREAMKETRTNKKAAP